MSDLLTHLQAYAAKGYARFHMPGHKGRALPPFDEISRIDLTELPETGDLYFEKSGEIQKAEARAAEIFGVSDCFFLTGGSTQGIFAMLSALRQGSEIYAARNCHRSIHNAIAILGLKPIWFPSAPPDDRDLSKPLIYTSPDYFGNIPKRPAGDLILCDAAHGAHLPFCVKDYKPPGNIFVVSAHKNLSSLGQTALLLSDGLIGKDLIRARTSVFGTASPSFPLLASNDKAITDANNGDWERISEFTKPYRGENTDPAKLIAITDNPRLDAEMLIKDFGIVPEMIYSGNIIFMLSPHNTENELARLKSALDKLGLKPNKNAGINLHIPKAAMPPREAFFAPREQAILSDSIGRIAAEVIAPSPPGIPIFSFGEIIDKKGSEILSKLCYNERRVAVSAALPPSRLLDTT